MITYGAPQEMLDEQDDFNNSCKNTTKCYCGHTTMCDCVDMLELGQIPEEPKQETLEEAAERLYPGVDRQVDRMLFINGAKWQQEKKRYSKEDLRNAYRWGTTVNHGTKEHFNELFEQFKKK